MNRDRLVDLMLLVPVSIHQKQCCMLYFLNSEGVSNFYNWTFFMNEDESRTASHCTAHFHRLHILFHLIDLSRAEGWHLAYESRRPSFWLSPENIRLKIFPCPMENNVESFVILAAPRLAAFPDIHRDLWFGKEVRWRPICWAFVIHPFSLRSPSTAKRW